MAFIEVYLPDGRVEHFELSKGSMTIGRSSEADITVQLPAISRVHARFEKGTKNRWTVTDLDSRNKTFIDRQPVKSHVLTNRDVFYFGSIKVVFQDPSGASDEKATQTVYHKIKKAADAPRTNQCPRCRTEMPDHAIVCMGCGYNIKTGKSLKLQVNGSDAGSGVVTMINDLTPPKGSKADSDDDNKKKTAAGLTENRTEFFMEWILPAALIGVCLLLALVVKGLAGLLAFAVLMPVTAILIFAASLLAAKFGEFGFAGFGNAVLKFFAVAAVYAFIRIVAWDSVWNFVIQFAALLPLYGLLTLFFDTDLFGCGIVTALTGIFVRALGWVFIALAFSPFGGNQSKEAPDLNRPAGPGVSVRRTLTTPSTRSPNTRLPGATE